MARRQRDSTEIIAELLRAATDGRPKTHLFRMANTNHRRGNRYLERMVDAELVVESDGVYHVSEEGQRFLRHWSEVESRLPLPEPF